MPVLLHATSSMNAQCPLMQNFCLPQLSCTRYVSFADHVMIYPIALQALPTTTTHLLRQKAPPSSRFSSPAGSLPPHLRSYRNFTQTALLDSGSLSTQPSGSQSARESSSGPPLATLQGTVEKRSGCKTAAKKKGGHHGGQQARSLSAQPDCRSAC